MLSKYFEYKTKTDSFIKNIEATIDELKDKKVLLYGFGSAFVELNKKYNFLEKLNIIAIADKKYEKPNKQSAKDELITVIKKIKPNDITDIDFDYILLSNENPKSIINFLIDNLHIKREIIKPLFIEEIYEICK